MTSLLHTHPWLLLAATIIVIFALDATISRVADRWLGPPARSAGADPLPAAPASADDIGVSFVGADWDVEWDKAWPR